MKRFYVDTNIWLDYAFERKDNIRPLGELAFQFLKKCRKNRWQVLYSDLVLKELRKQLTKEEIEERCFRIISEASLLVKVEKSITQAEEAVTLSKKDAVPGPDAMHAILARDNKAVLISRDFHFKRLSRIVSAFLPEEI